MSETSDFKPVTGHCLCGAVTYSITRKPLFSGLCYCHDCRRANASAFSPWVYTPLEFFELSDTKSTVKQIVSTCASGNKSARNFCSDCGSLVYSQNVSGENCTVTWGTLDEEFQKQYEPTIAVFVKDRPRWAKLDHELKEFEMMPQK